jgi:signal transduction histidine kinase
MHPQDHEEPSSELLERRVRSLRLRYALSLLALAVLVVLAGISLQRATARHDAINAHVIDVVGRQRMLSQRLAKAALALVTQRPPAAPSSWGEIRRALTDWKQSHESILQTDLMVDARRSAPSGLHELFKALEPEYVGMNNAALTLLRGETTESSEKKIWEDVELLLMHQRSYLALMEQITQAIVQESSGHEKQVRRVIVSIALAILLTLFFEGALVFRPALRQLAESIHRIAQAWSQVSRRKQELLTLLGALPDLLLRYTAEGEYLGSFTAQPEDAARLLHRIKDWSIRSLMPPAQAAECLECFQRVLSRGGVARFECMLRVDDTRCHAEMRIFSLQPNEVIVLVRDVSVQRTIERRILEAVDQEQQRMGRELHDGLCQDLSGMTMMLRSGLQKLHRGETIREELFSKLQQFAEQASADVRQTVQGLVPVELDAHGLAFSLSKLVERLAGSSGVEYDCDISLDGYEPSRAEALHLYRIAQEAVSNALRHGAPSHISVTLICEPSGRRTDVQRELVLKIQDDGSGIRQKGDSFDGSGGPGGRTGMGLRTMMYRAQSIGAWLHIGSSEGGGTLVSCRLPLTESPESRAPHAPSSTHAPSAVSGRTEP